MPGTAPSLGVLLYCVMFTKLNPVKSIVIMAVLEEDIIKVQGKGSHLAKVTHLINGSKIGARDFPWHQPPLVHRGTYLLTQGIYIPKSKASNGI